MSARRKPRYDPPGLINAAWELGRFSEDENNNLARTAAQLTGTLGSPADRGRSFDDRTVHLALGDMLARIKVEQRDQLRHYALSGMADIYHGLGIEIPPEVATGALLHRDERDREREKFMRDRCGQQDQPDASSRRS